MIRIMDQPYDRDQLRAMSKDGKQRVAGVVAVTWHDLLGRSQESFEEEVARRLTGSQYGLADIGIRLVGCLGENLLLEVSGDVSMLLGDYEAIMAEEARPTAGPPGVTDRASAEAFVRWCVRRIGPGYHPDTPAAEYVEAGTALPSFTPEKARLLDELHERAFSLLGDDEPYRIALEEATAFFQAGEGDQSGPDAERGEHAS